VTTWAVFGGSFDPPHCAHVLVATYVLATEAVDGVLVIPTFQHPLAKAAVAPFEHRVRMSELAFADLRRVEVLPIEGELGGESRTLRTLEALAQRRPGDGLRLVMGADLLSELPRWHAFDRIRALAPPIVIGRRGGDAPPQLDWLAQHPPTPALFDVSSREVRSRLLGESDDAWLDRLVPASVLAYARAHRLYPGASG
jgi:nicotinate-nucleotide adenylyltransferase